MTPDASRRLANRILWSLVGGAVAGVIAQLIGSAHPPVLIACRELATTFLEPLGQVFLRLLFFVVVPLVFSSLALGVVQLERLGSLGPMALRTGLLFLVNMVISVALGLALMNLIQPGRTLDPAVKTTLMQEYGGQAQQSIALHSAQPSMSPSGIVDLLLPRNVAKAVVDFQILPLIVFALLVGAAGVSLPPPRRQQLQDALGIISDLMTRIVHYALCLAPLAVPALVFSVIVKAGLKIILALGLFTGLCLASMAIHLFGTLSLMLKLFSRRSPLEFFRGVKAILVTAFSTSSSNATLPTSLQVSRDVLGLSPTTTGFVLPLGATMNMSGTALYEGCVVLFIAQVFGVHLALGQQVTLLCLSVLSAVAVAGIPGGSLPLLAGLLVTFGLPAEGLAIILGVDRLLDMARTVLNVAADVATAVIVDEQVSTR